MTYNLVFLKACIQSNDKVKIMQVLTSAITINYR